MKKTVKIILGTVILLIVLAAIAFFAMKKGLFDLNGDELKIDETANVVTEIKKISEFTSACFYEEIILRETKTTKAVDNTVGEKSPVSLERRKVL